jgi:hypothetical protein
MQRYQQWLWQKAVPLLAVVSTLSLGGCSQSADNTKTVPPPVKQAATTTSPPTSRRPPPASPATRSI